LNGRSASATATTTRWLLSLSSVAEVESDRQSSENEHPSHGSS